jgi:hypothetical protein
MGVAARPDIAAMPTPLIRRVAVLLSVVGLVPAVGASAAGASTSSSATVSGPITELGSSWFTLQTAGRRVGVINALTDSANSITAANTPYVWAGGHAQAGVASIGSRGPGSTGRRRGFDCSGAVAAVLAGAGLWPSGAGVPPDNGVIAELLARHLIAPGVGTAPDAVTLYDDPGVHIFMNIDGRFFGTSDGAGGGDPAGGAGWLADGAADATNPAYRKYHVLPAVLAQRTSYDNDDTFQVPAGGRFAATQGNALGISLGELSTADLLVGERVSVSYRTSSTGARVIGSLAVISGGPVLAPPTTPATATTAPTTTTATATATSSTAPPTSSPAPSPSGGAGYGGGGSSGTGGAPLG